MTITINGSGDINSSGNDIELNNTGTTDVTLAVGGGSVGVGTASPEAKVHIYESDVRAPSTDADDLVIEKSGDTGLSILSTTTGRIYFGDAAGDDQGSIRYVHSDDSMRFETNSVEAARIDSNGHTMFATTDNVVQTNSGTGNGGVVIRGGSNPYLAVASDGSAAGEFNRLASDGVILNLRQDGTAVGSIKSQSGILVLKGDANSTNGPLINIQNSTDGTCLTLGVHSSSYGYIGDQSGAQVGIAFVGGAIKPVTSADGSVSDNNFDFGTATARWDDLYATNGTIQTSDASEKQDIAELDEAEKRVATAAKGLIRKFRWIDSVEEKNDDARIHIGVIAQDLKAAFEAEGLDPGRYAMFISTTWWEADETYTDDEGVEQTRTNTYDTAEEAPEGAVERTRLGVRYNQLLAFIIGAM